MDFSLSPEQTMVQEALTRFLRDDYPFEERRTRLAGGARDSRLWRDLAQTLGILGAALPAEAGGMGGGAVDTMIIQECLGYALVTEPYLETIVIAGGILKRTGGSAALTLLEGIIGGYVRVAFAGDEAGTRYDLRRISARAVRDGERWRLDGRKRAVTWAPDASHFIVAARTSGEPGDADGLSLFSVPADTPGIVRHDVRLIDERPASDLVFDSAHVPAEALLGNEDNAWPLVEQAGDEAIAALCAEAVGVLRRMLADTLDYTKQRRQFGQPLSNFQALQHRMVDMFIKVEEAAAAALLATLSLDRDRVTRGLATSAAKATISASARFVGQNAVQLHGAMGLTEELPVGHFFKRATAIEGQFGSMDYHLARYATLSREQAGEAGRTTTKSQHRAAA